MARSVSYMAKSMLSPLPDFSALYRAASAEEADRHAQAIAAVV